MKTYNEIAQMAEKSDVLLTAFDKDFLHYHVFYGCHPDSQEKTLLIQLVESLFYQGCNEEKLMAKDGKEFYYPSYFLKKTPDNPTLSCFNDKKYNSDFVENSAIKFFFAEPIDYADYEKSVKKAFNQNIKKLNEEALNRAKRQLAGYETWLGQNPKAIDEPQMNNGIHYSQYGKIGTIEDFIQWYCGEMFSIKVLNQLREKNCQNHSSEIVKHFGWTKEQLREAGNKFVQQAKCNDRYPIALIITKLIDSIEE